MQSALNALKLESEETIFSIEFKQK